MAKLSIFFILCLAEISASAGCFAEHLQEALTHNKTMAPIYQRWAFQIGGEDLKAQAEKTSVDLIRSEQLTKAILAPYFDWRAEKYESSGVRLWCESFVPFGSMPEPKIYPAQNESAKFPDLDPLVAQLIDANKTGHLLQVQQSINLALKSLGNERFNCLTRHTLESIFRFAKVAPQQISGALNKRLPTPAPLIRNLIFLQIKALRGVQRIDRKAAPVQQAGIPIICADMPAVL